MGGRRRLGAHVLTPWIPVTLFLRSAALDAPHHAKVQLTFHHQSSFQLRLIFFRQSLSASLSIMVHYIRFLRTPYSDVSKKTIDVSAVVAIQTDLSDALLSQDVSLLADIVEANGSPAHSPFSVSAVAGHLKSTKICYSVSQQI